MLPEHNPENWLGSNDADERLAAMAVYTTPGKITAQNIDAFLACAKRSYDEPNTLAVAAMTLGGLEPELVTQSVLDCLAGYLTRADHNTLRGAAAHALFRLNALPASAHDPLSAMLFDPVKSVREIALMAISVAPTQVAAPLAQAVTAAKRPTWTREALIGLVQSAGDAPLSRQQICAFLRAEIEKDANGPAVIAGYVALIQSDGSTEALNALCDAAVNPRLIAHRATALEALAGLGEKAKGAGPALAELLTQVDDPATETLLCKTLGKIRIDAEVVPVARASDRIVRGPEIILVPYCGLLSLHPQASKDAAASIKKRSETASDGARGVLAFTYRALTGEVLK